MSRVVIISVVLALASACSKKDPGKADPKVVESGSAAAPAKGSATAFNAPAGPGTPATPDSAPGAATPDAAAQGLFDALAKKDKAAVKRFIPNPDSCKALTAVAHCAELDGAVDKAWDQLTAATAPYAKAQLAKSKDPSPIAGGVSFVAALDGKDPMIVTALKAGDRYFAVFDIGTPKPPSTGKEMPKDQLTMKPEQAKAIVAEALKLAAAPNPDCTKITNALNATLPVAYPEMQPEAMPAYKVLQHCALDTKHWRSAVQAGVKQLPFNPDNFTVVQIVRALAEMGEYDQAFAAVKELAKQFPKAEEALEEIVVYVFCRAEAWDKCEKTATAALALFAKRKDDPKSEPMVLGHFFRDLAWVVTGKPREAVKDAEAIEKMFGGEPPKPFPSFAVIKTEAAKSIEHGFYMEVVPVPQLPTGIYHLMGKESTGALVTLKLREQTGVARKFRIEAEVPGVTEKSSNSLTLGAKESTIKYINPPLKMDFDPTKVRGPRPSQLALKIIEETKTGDKSIVDETIPIEVLPRDYLPLQRKIGADKMVPTYGYLGAWITSNDKAVDEFLGKAKLRTPKHQFAGEQETTVPQIRAIFDELKGRGMSYVMDPEVTAMTAFVQRTRLPGDVLSSTNAQCLEGTLTFATLMEAIGIKPIVVLVPGHAFVGWHTVAADGTKGEPLFVETTMVGSYDFDQAVKVATGRVASELKAGSFKTGASTFVDIAAIHAQGYTAQPM
jgi:hypothetical protein